MLIKLNIHHNFHDLQEKQFRTTGHFGLIGCWFRKKSWFIYRNGIDTTGTPLRTTVSPWQLWCKWGKEIVNGQSNQRRVVGDDTNWCDYLTSTNTSKCRINFPNLHWTLRTELTQKHLEIVHRFSNNKQHDHIPKFKHKMICGDCLTLIIKK